MNTLGLALLQLQAQHHHCQTENKQLDVSHCFCNQCVCSNTICWHAQILLMPQIKSIDCNTSYGLHSQWISLWHCWPSIRRKQCRIEDARLNITRHTSQHCGLRWRLLFSPMLRCHYCGMAIIPSYAQGYYLLQNVTVVGPSCGMEIK